jgi:hypothetical protein
VKLQEFAFGARFMTSRKYAIRVSTHVLVGYATANGTKGSGEAVIGLGFDLALFRIQVEGVGGLNVAGIRPNANHLRLIAGGVIPLCLRGCGEDDFINVSRRRPVPDAKKQMP